MKMRQNLYIDRQIGEALEALAAKPGVTKSGIVNDALAAWIARRGAKEVDDLLKIRPRSNGSSVWSRPTRTAKCMPGRRSYRRNCRRTVKALVNGSKAYCRPYRLPPVSQSVSPRQGSTG